MGYDIGYAKPPRRTRFEKGISGNKKGRPKKKPFIGADIIRSLINQPLPYPVGKRIKLVSRVEGLIRNHGGRALKGSVKDAADLMNIVDQSEKYGDINPIVVWLSERDMNL